MKFVQHDGGRASSGFVAQRVGDCGTRAVAIAAGLDYRDAYDRINAAAALDRHRRRSDARTGVWPETITRVLAPLGWRWTPTMTVGAGCTTHLRADELPSGRLVVRLSRHYAAIVDGVLYDTHDCSRDGSRCVYGYWTKG